MTLKSDTQIRFTRERRDESVTDLIIEAREELKRLDKKLDEHAAIQTFHAFQRVYSYLQQVLDALQEGHGD